jgi:hypothetical protein
VLFRGVVGNPARVHHNVLRYTSGATAYCGLKYKHATYNTTWEADHNLISKAPGIGPVAEPSYIHHNTIADADFTNSHICSQDDGGGIMLCDNGGTAFTGASRIEYNTVYHGRGYTWKPDNDWGTDDLTCVNCGSFGTLSVKYNVFQDNDAAYTVANAIANIDAYGADADYTSVITGGLLTENNNCFYNDAAATLQWTFYGAAPAGAGNYYTFAQLQSAGYEAAGFSQNPTLSSALIAGAANCLNFGWNKGESVSSTAVTPINVLNSKKRGKKWKLRN